MPLLEGEFVTSAFANHRLNVFMNKEALRNFLLTQHWKNKNLLLMSSGNFAGMDATEVASQILDVKEGN